MTQYTDLSNYVLASELTDNLCKSRNSYKYWVDKNKVIKVGGFSFINRHLSRTGNYALNVDSCTNLAGYFPAGAFLKLMNVSSSFFATLDKRPREGCDPIESMYIGKVRFIKIPNWVKTQLETGKQVRILTSLDAGYYEEVYTKNGIIYGTIK